jgi:signal peptidase II
MGFLLPALIVVVLDQATKQFFWHLGRNFDLIDGILRITLAKNTGAAFSIFPGKRIFFIAASSVASLIIFYLGLKVPAGETRKRVALSLILGGALGNLVDRVYPGEVIDFIDMGIGVHRWPVYNVADIAVTAGVALLFLSFFAPEKSANGG